MSWSNDGTIVAGAGGNGSVGFGSIVDRKINWSNIEATLDEDDKVTVTDYVQSLDKTLDYSDRVVAMSIQFGQMIVCTTNTCNIYNI